MNIFDVLGPVMVGPSSSHTAGAVKIGYITRLLLGEEPKDIEIKLHGSFAATGKGHGTDKALVAGLLGMKADNEKIPKSFEIAAEGKINYHFESVNISNTHPNTAAVKVTGQGGKTIEVEASSLGGGRINLNKIDGTTVDCSGQMPTLIIRNIDKPGRVAEVSSLLAEHEINIGTLHLCRSERGGYAVMVVEMDQKINPEQISWLTQVDGVIKVTYIEGE